MSALRLPLLLTLAAFSIGSLVSGAAYVEWRLPGGLPLGNILAAAALLGLAGAACLLAPSGSRRRSASRLALMAALLWLPLSIALAGNLALNFSGTRGDVWMLSSLALFAAVLACLICAVAGRLWDAGKRPNGD